MILEAILSKSAAEIFSFITGAIAVVVLIYKRLKGVKIVDDESFDGLAVAESIKTLGEEKRALQAKLDLSEAENRKLNREAAKMTRELEDIKSQIYILNELKDMLTARLEHVHIILDTYITVNSDLSPLE